MENVEVAVGYLRLGFSVIPLQPQSKRPAGRWARYQYYPATEADLRVKWARNPEYNIGIITGAGATEEARRLVIFDFDDPDVYDAARAKLPPETCTVSSGREGGRHLWYFAPGPVPTRRLGGLDIKGAGGYCVVPPSVSSGGRTYEFERGPEQIAAISWEQLAHFGVRPLSELVEETRPAWIPEATWLVLQAQWSRLEFVRESRSEHEQAAICALIRAGADLETVWATFCRYAVPGTKFFALYEKGEARARQWLTSSYRSAREHVHERWNTLWDSFRITFGHLQGVGHRGEIAAVYAAMVTRAASLGYTEFECDVRTVAQAAGVSAATAARSMSRLAALGVITRTREAAGIKAARYVLNALEKLAKLNKSLKAICDNCTSSQAFDDFFTFAQHMGHDLFSGSGLGKNGLRIYARLKTEGSQRVKALSDALGLSKHSIRLLLARLEDVGLVTRSGRDWQLAPDADLDAAAEQLGLVGVGVRRQFRHISERVAYERKLGLRRPEHHRRKALLADGLINRSPQ